MDFISFRKLFTLNFQKFIQSDTTFFLANIPNDTLWETYINSFPANSRQEFNCSACRHFIKNYGNLCRITEDYRIESIWHFSTTNALWDSLLRRMMLLFADSSIVQIFQPNTTRLGTEQNLLLRDDNPVVWTHLWGEIPDHIVVSNFRHDYPDISRVFARALTEFSERSLVDILTLIEENNLYRGDQFLDTITSFLQLKKEYEELPSYKQEFFVWKKLKRLPVTLTNIRNTSIGTLLKDLNNEVPLDQAVLRFESVMAPSNYQRPKAIFSKRMLEEAKQTLENEGLLDSLPRCFATIDDIRASELLYQKPLASINSNIFETLEEKIVQNPNNFRNIQQVTLQDFLTSVLPGANSLEILFENRLVKNLFSLTGPINQNSSSLFSWNNPYSWSYTGGFADSMKEKVKAAGGVITGKLRCSLEWYNYDDLDLHLVHEETKKHIYYPADSRKAIPGGFLDVDENAGSGRTRTPVENIIFRDNLPFGTYHLYVKQFFQRETKDIGFRCEIEYENSGNVYSFSHDAFMKSDSIVTAFRFTYNQQGLTILTESNSCSSSKKVWNLNTNTFVKVKAVTNSPNYWGGQSIGAKHLFFFLEDAQNEDSLVRGFFNENLRADLKSHRKVFEALVNESIVQKIPGQEEASGLGFCTTNRDSLIVKTNNRVFKVII